LQILEDSGKYWLYQYYRYWKISYEVAECTCIFFFDLSVRLLCLLSTQIFQILHITIVYSEGGMDRQGYASSFSRPLLLPLLFSPSSHTASSFPGPFLPVSLYPVHSLSEIPLNRHRNVYVKLTPQSGQPLKTIWIFWSHRWTVYRSFRLYIIYWRCAYCLELVFGRIFDQNSELLNLANFCEKSWHTPLRYMVCPFSVIICGSFLTWIIITL
jgi:hypothetical protein